MDKIIYTNTAMTPKNGKPWMNAHVLGGYGRTINDYRALIKELRKTFPQARLKDIECTVVTTSTWCKGFSIVRWGGYIVDDINLYPGWRRSTRQDYSTA